MNKTVMVIEMAMDQDMYMTCKYILLVVSRKRKRVHDLVRVLLGFADAHRPSAIEMKKEVYHEG